MHGEKMWRKLWLWFPLATIVSCLLNHVACQGRDAPEAPDTLKCVTHDFEKWICSWNDSSTTTLKITYEVCYWAHVSQKCITTEETSFEFDGFSFQTTEVKIIAKNGNGTAERTFQVTESSVSFIPYEPQILQLTPDYPTSTLLVEWKGNSSSFLAQVPVSWEIQFMRTDKMEVAKTVLLNTIWTHNEEVLHYNWKSDLPLECTSHSVRITCYVDDKDYTGAKEWSDWSLIKTVPGNITSSSLFPEDKVIQAGSDIMFCCINGQGVQTIHFGNTKYPLIHLSDISSAIQVYNVNVSISSGTNIICNWSAGTVLFVGYPPDVPQHLSCETRSLNKITCSWNVGRQTGLYGKRATKYILYERFSGENVTCVPPPVDHKKHQCHFWIRQNENLYNFTLCASNPLGKSESALLIDVRQRVHPEAPANLIISNDSSRKVTLSWSLPGNFTPLKLNCEIETSRKIGDSQLMNVSLSGKEHNSHYSASVEKLHPFTTYVFHVRCSALEHFWKWSEWSYGKTHTTAEAHPQREPDVWREIVRSTEGRTVVLYWKPLSENDTNGQILDYVVSWSAPNGNPLRQNHSVDGHQNKTEIKLDDNSNYVISVVARNSAGDSPAATINTIELPNGNVETEQAVGTGDGINITWNHDSTVTCGITVQWQPSSSSNLVTLDWDRFSSERTDAWITSSRLQPGVRYTFSIYACKDDNVYQLLKKIIAYLEELPPAAPNFTVLETTSNSVQIMWDDIPVEALRGFLKGYLIYIAKNDDNSTTMIQGRTDVKVNNITDTKIKILTIRELESGTRYVLGLQAYTGGGKSPLNSLHVDTPDNLVGLILAIFFPIAVALLFGVVTSTICYRKREWLKETFYPEIPNPQNSKALQFQNSISEGNPALKTLEMNPCTPNNVEVVETLSTVPKIVDTEPISSVTDSDDLENNLIEDDSDSETENHIVVSYCPPIIDEELSNPAVDDSAESSQVVYLDIQSMYQPQSKSEEEAEIGLEDMAGYKPQMQLPINTVNLGCQLPAEDDADQSAGYKPQVNVQDTNLDSPDSPTSTLSYGENTSFGSPCSTNSRHFLIPPEEDKDSIKPTHTGWSFTSFFQNKPDE